jgi:protein MpaA
MSLEILHQPSWGRSASGRFIDLYSSLHTSERPLLFIGGVHGDEPEGVELAQKLLSWLRKNNKSEFHPWILIPCLNPDGYLNQDRVNGSGVDLNRNFPSSDWSPLIKALRYNPGPGPGSEPEVQALCALIEATKPQVIIHFHSWEPCVVYTGSSGKSWAEKVAGTSGYTVREDIGYPTPGSLGQYGWLNHQIPVVCIEEQEKIDLQQVWPRFSNGLESVLSRSQNFSKINL